MMTEKDNRISYEFTNVLLFILVRQCKTAREAFEGPSEYRFKEIKKKLDASFDVSSFFFAVLINQSSRESLF